jgi:hypothetical protein
MYVPRQMRVTGRSHDAIGIATVALGVSRVDQQRLSLGGDDEGRLPALDIDEIDVKARRGADAGHDEAGEGSRGNHALDAHGACQSTPAIQPAGFVS